MGTSKKDHRHILKIAVSILALLNLVALFVFHYELPEFFHASRPEKEVASTDDTGGTESVPDTATDQGYSIQLDSDTLTYDGSSQLELLQGVSLVDAQGSPVDGEIFASITTGGSLDEKIITYSADTEQGQITARRSLKLQNYSGPTITLPETLPDITEEQLDSLLSYMPSDGTFAALDGFGNDITSSVKFKYATSESEPSLYHCTFTVTNMFNDSAAAEMDLSLNATRPVLTLTERAVTLSTNSSFNALSYVATAVDREGNSLFQRISIDGEVNTAVPGVYTLTYYVIDENGETSVPMTLEVTVE